MICAFSNDRTGLGDKATEKLGSSMHPFPQHKKYMSYKKFVGKLHFW